MQQAEGGWPIPDGREYYFITENGRNQDARSRKLGVFLGRLSRWWNEEAVLVARGGEGDSYAFSTAPLPLPQGFLSIDRPTPTTFEQWFGEAEGNETV